MKKFIVAFILSNMISPFCIAGPTEKAVFAGGCFWCMEPPFEKLPGVKSVVSGFAGGRKKDPTYREVSDGSTGHVEAVLVTYDPKLIRYEDLLEVFWRQINPTDSGGQFVDRGEQYTTSIFYFSDDQKKIAELSKENLQKSGRFQKPLVTTIRKATEFYPAEDYHQDYYKKNPVRYKYYRYRSGRDEYIDKTWGKDQVYKPNHTMKTDSKYQKPSAEEIKKRLSPLQYAVTQKEKTEPPFKNEYWDNKMPGIYVDVVTGEPLFSSLDKFDSGTGWPSFTKPLVAENILERVDRSLFIKRTEVRSKHGDSHLGHVFTDGPQPTGLRYCINSASLRFIPADKLESEGLSEFLKYFKSK